MSDITIRVDSLCKRYRIGKRETYTTLRETLTEVASAPFRKAGTLLRRAVPDTAELSPDSIWALEDVSFEVPRGAVIGIIGRNGTGNRHC